MIILIAAAVAFAYFGPIQVDDEPEHPAEEPSPPDGE
jgi:hypothetical protein